MILATLAALASMWSWNASDTATSYKLYWSSSPTRWDRAYSVSVGNATTYDDTSLLHLTDPQPSSVVYWIVTASNQFGESVTEHGEIEGPPPGVGGCLP